MGIFDIFKTKPEKQTLKFEELEEFIKNKKKQISEQEKDIVLNIKQELNELIEKFKENLAVLEKIDLKDKKVEEKIKFIVRENFEKYKVQFEKLIETLVSLEITDYENSIVKLNSIFANFEKRTYINFEKSTFLIGKELGSVKDSISYFFNNINKLLKEKKEFIDSYKVIGFIDKELFNIKTLAETKKEINNNIENNHNNIRNLKEQKKNNENEIIKIKKSDKYKAELEEGQELDKQNDLIEKQIYSIKGSIDFKSLSTLFHSNDKHMKIINEHKHNFKESFIKAPDHLIKILHEAGINNCDFEINNLIEENNKIQELKHNLTNQEIKKISSIENHIKTILSDITLADEEIIKENKRLEKLEENKKQVQDLIKNELKKINIELIL